MKHILTATIGLLITLSVWGQESEDLQTLIQLSRFGEAIKLIEGMEPSRELALQKVTCYKALGQYRVAKNELITLSEQYPDDIIIRSELAHCYEALDEPRAGLECYAQLIDMDSTNQFFRLKMGDLLYKVDDYDSALVVFKKLLEQDSLISSVKRIALCHDKKHEYETAAQYYNLAYTMDSTDMNALGNLINIHLKIQNYKKAIEISEEYIAKDSTNNMINLMNALGFYGIDEYEEAVPRFMRCYNNNDTSLIVNRSLGISLYSTDRNGEAIGYLENAFRQDSTNNNVLYCMAVTYTDLDRHKESLDCYLKLLTRITPKNMEMFLYHRNAANEYYNLEQYENALEYYKKSLAYGTEEQNLKQYYAIAFLYRDELKNQKKSLEYLDLYTDGLHKSLKILENKEHKDQYDQRDIYDIKLSLRAAENAISQMRPKASN